MKTPCLLIATDKIEENAKTMTTLCRTKGIDVVGVTKAASGHPEVARAMQKGGVTSLGDSRLRNIALMRQAGIAPPFILLRSPSLSEAGEVVALAEVSLNTEVQVIEQLSMHAKQQGTDHGVILMLELGDMREGIPLTEVDQVLQRVAQLPNIHLLGLGTNLACLLGVAPDQQKMAQLSVFVDQLEQKHGVRFTIISGGNSANYLWLTTAPHRGRINNLRLGESILLGVETLHRTPIQGLHTDAFTLIAEVIEAKTKKALYNTVPCQNAFGRIPPPPAKEVMHRIIVNLGRQDVCISGIRPLGNMEILDGTSDHLVLRTPGNTVEVGCKISFSLNYRGLVSAMTSPYVHKYFIPEHAAKNRNSPYPVSSMTS